MVIYITNHSVSQDMTRTNDPHFFDEGRQSISIISTQHSDHFVNFFATRGRYFKGHTVELRTILRRVGTGALHLYRQRRQGENSLPLSESAKKAIRLIRGGRVWHGDEQCRHVGTIWYHFLCDGRKLYGSFCGGVSSLTQTSRMMVHWRSCPPKRPVCPLTWTCCTSKCDIYIHEPHHRNIMRFCSLQYPRAHQMASQICTWCGPQNP